MNAFLAIATPNVPLASSHEGFVVEDDDDDELLVAVVAFASSMFAMSIIVALWSFELLIRK
jgi:hypothetical protein